MDKAPEKSLLVEAKERFKIGEEAWSENHRLYLDDIRFKAGDQWPEVIKRQREKDNRPCLVVDKINQYIRQVVNDGRQNRPSIKVRPVDGFGDVKTAKVFDGLFRHIENKSNADHAYDWALECSASGGFGFFRVLTEYESPGTFNQEIRIRRIRNPLTVILDPEAMEADGSDAKWGFIVDEISRKDFEKQYPKSDFLDWDTNESHYGDWMRSDKVRIAEYFYIDETEENVHLLNDGTTVGDNVLNLAIAEGIIIPEIVETRKIPRKDVKWCRLSGAEVLEKRDWAGKYIPIIPVYGNEYDIDGKIVYSGLVRAAKDPLKLYNYSRSAFAEIVALTPKAPYIAADGQVDDYYNEWSTANTNNVSVLRYKPVDVNGTPVPPPQRQPAASIPVGFAADMQISEHDIEASIGMYAETLGRGGNATSGKQELLKQRKGDTATFHYYDNFNRAIRYLGKILLDLAPHVYDSSRVLRILGEDGETSSVQIDPQSPDAFNDSGVKAIYNLGVGKYDVAITTGPSFNTKRMESADAMITLAQANPQMWATHGDLMVKSQDWPNAEEFAERTRLFLPPEVQQAESNKDQSPEVQAVIAQAQQAIKQRDEAFQQLQQQGQKAIQGLEEQLQAARKEDDSVAQRADEALLKSQIEQKKLEIEERKVEIDAFNAETARIKAMCEADKKCAETHKIASEPVDITP